MKTTQTNKKFYAVAIIIFAVMFCVATAAFSLIEFTDADKSVFDASAQTITGSSDFVNMPKSGKISTDYILELGNDASGKPITSINVNVSSSKIRDSVFGGTFDGNNNTIVFDEGSGDYKLFGNDSSESVNQIRYVGLLFGQLSAGAVIKNLNIVYSIDLTLNGKNTATRPNDRSNTGVEENSTTLYGGIICGLANDVTFENVHITLSSGATFAVIGTDGGSTDAGSRGPGQGSVAGAFAAAITGNITDSSTTMINCSLDNNGIIFARSHNQDAGNTYTYSDWGDKTFTLSLPPTETKCAAISGGVFGNIISGRVNVDYFSMYGSGAVGSYCVGNNNKEGGLKANFSGGFVGKVNDGSEININGLVFQSKEKVFVAVTSLGKFAGLITGHNSGTANLNYLWRSTSSADASYYAQVGVSTISGTTSDSINVPGSLSSDSSAKSNNFSTISSGYGILSIPTLSNREYSETMTYNESEIPGYKRIIAIENGILTLEVCLNDTEYYLSYIQYGSGDQYDQYFDSNWNGANGDNVKEFTIPYTAEKNWNVKFAKMTPVSLEEFVLSDNKTAPGAVKAYSGPTGAFAFGMTPKSGINSFVSGIEWVSTHYYIDNTGNKIVYELTDEEGNKYEATGNSDYDTVSNSVNTCYLDTAPNAGVYRITLYDKNNDCEIKDGTRIALDNNNLPTVIYTFKSSDLKYFEYKITKAAILITPLSNSTISKEYDGTTSVPASQIIRGVQYDAVLYEDSSKPSWLTPQLLVANDSAYATEDVGTDINVTLSCKVDEISDFMQVDPETGEPVSSNLYFEIEGLKGTILQRSISIVFGRTSLTYDGTELCPEVTGGVAITDDQSTQNILQNEIDELLSDPDSYEIYTFLSERDKLEFASGGYINYDNYDAPINVGTGYYVMIKLTDDGSSSNFKLDPNANGSVTFEIVQRIVTYEWNDASLNPTYSGYSLNATATFANIVAGESIKYIVSYDGESVAGVKNAGNYDVSISLDYSDFESRNYKLSEDCLPAVMTVKKYQLTLGYYVGTATVPELNTQPDGTSYADYNGKNFRNTADGLHVRISGNNLPDSDMKLNNATGNSIYIILNYYRNGVQLGEADQVINAGTYTVYASFGNNYSDSELGGMNYVLSNVTHTFVVNPKSVELTKPSKLEFTYDATNVNLKLDKPAHNASEDVELGSRYYNEAGDLITSFSNVGTYYVEWFLTTASSVNSNYVLTGETIFEYRVLPLDISTPVAGFKLLIKTEKVQYTGAEIDLTVNDIEVTALNGRLSMTLDKDFTMKCSNNSARGFATVSISGINNFSGEFVNDRAFEITARHLIATILFDGVAVTNNSQVVEYDGNNMFSRFSVELEGILDSDIDNILPVVYMSTGVNVAVNVGSYYIYASFEDESDSSNYDMTETVMCTLNVSPAPLTVSAVPDTATSGSYSGNSSQYFVTYDKAEKGLVGELNGLMSVDAGKLSVTVNYTLDGGTLSGKPVNAGSYNVSLYPSGDQSVLNNYTYQSETVSRLTINKRDVSVRFVGDFVNKVYTVEYSGSPATVLWDAVTADEAGDGTGLIAGDSLNLTIYYGSDASPVNVGNYMLSVISGTNPNYNITPPEQHTLVITPKEIILKITYNTLSAEFKRNGQTYIGKIYDGVPFDNIRNISYAFGDDGGDYKPIEDDEKQMTVIFSYYGADGGVLNSAPVNAGYYSVSVMLYQYDSGGSFIYPAANYRVLTEEESGETTELDFQIARRYVNVVFNYQASVSYSASDSARKLALGSNNGSFNDPTGESNSGNTGAVGDDTEKLSFKTLLIKDGTALSDYLCIDVGTYVFAGYLDPDPELAVNANYEINPALFPDAADAIYYEDEFGSHKLTVTNDPDILDCTLNITPYSSTIIMDDLIAAGNFSNDNLFKEYGSSDGNKLHYLHVFELTNYFTSKVTQESVEMIFIRRSEGTIEDEAVGIYALTGLELKDEEQQKNFKLSLNSGNNSFTITRRPIIYEPDLIERDFGEETYDENYAIEVIYGVYLEAFAAFEGVNPNFSVTLYLHRDGVNPNAGTYDLSDRVECSDRDNFSVSLKQNSWIGKFRINPKQITVTLDLPGGNTLTEIYDPIRRSEPDFYAYVSEPVESQPGSGIYWDYLPLDTAYAEWLKKPEDKRESFSEFIKQFVRITRNNENNYNVGTYDINIVIIENGVASTNFTSSTDAAYRYWYRIERFDLNTVLDDLKIELEGLIKTTKEYDGTTNIVVDRPTTSDSSDKYKYYYDQISLRALAQYDSANVGDNKTITVSFSIDNDMFENNFMLPGSYPISGTITKRKLNVSIENFDSPINLTYGEIPSAQIVYTGFATGENASNVEGLSLVLRYEDGVAADALRNVGKYYLIIAASDASVEPVNYAVEYVNNSREVIVKSRLVTVSATGEVYKKPVDGTTAVPGFRSDETLSDSILNDYFVVNNVLDIDKSNLRISYGVSLNTTQAGDAAVLMEINNLYDATGNLNYAFDPAMAYTLRLSAEIVRLGSVSLPTVNTVYNGKEQKVNWSGTLLEMEGYRVTAEVRYSGTSGTVYNTSAVPPVNSGSYIAECYLILNADSPDRFEDIYATSSLIIDRARPTIVFSATDSVQEYGSFTPIRAWAMYAETEFEVELDTVKYSFLGEDGAMPAFVPAGTHTVTASYAGSENYYPVTSLNAQTTLKVTKKVVTMTFAGYNNLVYNGLDRSDDIIVTLSGVVKGDECYAVKRFSPAEVVNAGRYTLEVSLSNPNYITSGAISVGFTIAKKTLTVTAIAGETPYGTTPDFEYVYEGFVEGDTVEDLDTAPTVHLGGTMVGANNVAPSGGVDQNYDFAYNETILVLIRVNDAKKGLSNEWTVAIIIISVIAGVALMICLGYAVKTATYRSMYNVDAIKKKVRNDMKKK